MTTPARRLRPAARPTATCAACGQPMTVYEPDQTTHPACDPDVGWPPYGGGGRQRQLRLDDASPEQRHLRRVK